MVSESIAWLHLLMCAAVTLPMSKGSKWTGNDSEQGTRMIKLHSSDHTRTTTAELEKGQSGRDTTTEENFSQTLRSSEQSWGLKQGQEHTGRASLKAKAGRPPSRTHGKASPHFSFLDPSFQRYLSSFFPSSYFTQFWVSVFYFLCSVITFVFFFICRAFLHCFLSVNKTDAFISFPSQVI